MQSFSHILYMVTVSVFVLAQYMLWPSVRWSVCPTRACSVKMTKRIITENNAAK